MNKQSKAGRPPDGVRPTFAWFDEAVTNRIKELREAISRYKKAGLSTSEWENEISVLQNRYGITKKCPKCQIHIRFEPFEFFNKTKLS